MGVKGNAGQSAYSASKAGLEGFTCSLAKEVASRNIRVNLVAPGRLLSSLGSCGLYNFLDHGIISFPELMSMWSLLVHREYIVMKHALQ